MAAACLMLRRPELMLWGVGGGFMVPTCALKDPLRCTQTPWVISVLGAAQGYLALERGSIWLHGSCWAPCSAGIRSLCLSRQQDALQLLVQAAIPACCSLLLSGSTAQARGAPSLVHPLTLGTTCFPRVRDVVSSMAPQEPLERRSF